MVDIHQKIRQQFIILNFLAYILRPLHLGSGAEIVSLAARSRLSCFAFRRKIPSRLRSCKFSPTTADHRRNFSFGGETDLVRESYNSRLLSTRSLKP